MLILNLVQRLAEGRSGCQLRNYAKKSSQTWLAFTWVTWPKFHENGLIRCCRNLCRNRVLGCYFHGHVHCGKVDWTCARRGVYSWQRRPHHLCYCTNCTKVASLSSHPRNCVRDSNSGPQPVVALRQHSSVAYWSILITGSLLLTCIPLPHQIMARKFWSLFMIYLLSVQFSVPHSFAEKGHIFSSWRLTVR